VKVSGAPPLARLDICSLSKARHSCPVSIMSSFITKPHLEQTLSPRVWSSIKLVLPHSGHTISRFPVKGRFAFPFAAFASRGLFEAFLFVPALFAFLAILSLYSE
jgi:hypothetical protein